MQHFHTTQSTFSKFSETFSLPHPYRICWPPQLGQNRITASLNVNDATAPGSFAYISKTNITQIMQHFHTTQSTFSKFSETLPLPHPYRICWPPQLEQNRLSPRRSTSTTLQLRASLHIFLKRILHKLCNISIQLRVHFPNLARHTAPISNMLAPSTWTKSPITASLNVNDATAPGSFAYISITNITQIMQHFHRTQSTFSKFSETFPLPHPTGMLHNLCKIRCRNMCKLARSCSVVEVERRGDRRFCPSWGGQHIRSGYGRGKVSLNLENILWVLWKRCIIIVRYVVEICAN